MLIGTHGVEVGPLGILVGVRVSAGVNVGVTGGGFGVNVGVTGSSFGVNVGGKGGGVTPPPEAIVGGTGVTATNMGELSVEIGVNVGVIVGGLGVNVGVNVGGKGEGVTPPSEAIAGNTGVTVTNVGELSVEINVGVALVPVATVGLRPVAVVGVIPFSNADVTLTFCNEVTTVVALPPLLSIPTSASPPLFSTALNNSPTPANIPTTPNPIPSGINGIRRPVMVEIRSVLCC